MAQILHKETGDVLLEVDGDFSSCHTGDSRLRGKNLQGADLRNANLFYADFQGTDLSGADFSGSILEMASFDHATLSNANLLKASAIGTSFDRADLSNAILVGIDFRWCTFREANLAEATLTDSSFLQCIGLDSAKHLETITNLGAFGLDRDTLIENIAGLPTQFLQGCGYTPREIEAFRELYASGYVSCFLSHAEVDMPFAEKLLKDLRDANVSCWQYSNDMAGGQDWQKQIEVAIARQDKLLLICSRNSIYRNNVVTEIIRALNIQRTTGNQKLFPVRLDDHILSEEFMATAREKVITGQWAENWVPAVKDKHIPDFSEWKDESKYRKMFERLLADLSSE